MRRKLLILLMLVSAAIGPAQAEEASAQEAIQISDSPVPDASTFGIDSTRFPHVSYGGSTPQTIEAVLNAIPSSLGPGISQDILMALMSMPVYPDSASSVPKEWLLRRVDRMIRQGAYADALRLVGGVPDTLVTEPITRRYVDLALTLGDLKAGCARVQQALTSEQQEVDGYWSLRQAFCQRTEGKDSEAELTLAIYSEQFAGQQPLALALLQQWGAKTPPLPPFSSSDAQSVPLLVAALEHSASSHAQQRLANGFIHEKEIPAMTPAFAAALAKRDVFPLPLRLSLAAHAIASGAADPALLRGLLETLQPGDAVLPAHRTQAALIADIGTTRSAENKVSAVTHALTAFKRNYTPYVARGMFAPELESFAKERNDIPLTPELVLDLAAYAIERGNTALADSIRHYAAGKAGYDPGFAITHTAIQSALYYNRQLASEQTEAADIPVLTIPQRPGVMWTLRRLVMIQKANGVEVPSETAALSQSAPLANTYSANPASMLALEDAQNQPRTGELVLRSLELLGDGKLAFVSDEVFARCISALQKTGLHTYAAALAQAAILNPPTEALQAPQGSGAVTP